MDTSVNAEEQTTASEGNAEETVKPSLDEVMAKLKSLEATNARLLKESQEHKAKAKGLLSEKEKAEKDKLESEGKVKEAYQLALKKLQDKESEINKLKKVNINKTITAELARVAQDAHNIDDVKKFLPIEVLNITEEDDDIKIENFKEAVDVLKKEKPYLFKQANQVKTVSAKPGTTKQEPLDLSKMGAMELASLLAKTNSLSKN